MIPINTLHDLVVEVQALQEEQERLIAEIQKLKNKEQQAPLKPKILPKQPTQPKQETTDPLLAYFILRK